MDAIFFALKLGQLQGGVKDTLCVMKYACVYCVYCVYACMP